MYVTFLYFSQSCLLYFPFLCVSSPLSCRFCGFPYSCYGTFIVVSVLRAPPCQTEAHRLCLKNPGWSVTLDCIRLHQRTLQSEQRGCIFFYLKDKVLAFLVSSVHIRGWSFLNQICYLIMCDSQNNETHTSPVHLSLYCFFLYFSLSGRRK